MKQTERGVVEKWPSVASSVSQSHFLSLLCGFLGEKVDSFSPLREKRLGSVRGKVGDERRG